MILWLLALSVSARAVSDRAIDYLLKAAPRPAGMGGAFTAVADDPIGMFWNPSAALRSDRFAISGNHSLRHFPGKTKNLDQFNSDTTGIVIPLQGDLAAGLGFTIPGEWGVDYTDTNGVLPVNEKLMGRERRFAYSGMRDSEKIDAGYIDSDWRRYSDFEQGIKGKRSFETGGGFSFYYETNGGMSYGVNVRGLLTRLGGDKKNGDESCTVTLGAAYRPHWNAATLAATDVELNWRHGFEARFFGGVERSFDRRAFVRIGSMNGMTTYGFGGKFGSARFDYAVIKDFMPSVSGHDEVAQFQDGHFLSYTIR